MLVGAGSGVGSKTHLISLIKVDKVARSAPRIVTSAVICLLVIKVKS
jgi:hypothetical protein